MALSTFQKHTIALSKLKGVDAYSDAGAARKDTLHKAGRSWLRYVAASLGLEPGTYDIRSNQGGIAVSGEVTLHGENIYVQLSESCLHPGISVMSRTCKGRKDYTGGNNTFHRFSDLVNPESMERFLGQCRRMAHPGVPGL